MRPGDLRWFGTNTANGLIQFRTNELGDTTQRYVELPSCGWLTVLAIVKPTNTKFQPMHLDTVFLYHGQLCRATLGWLGQFIR